LADVADFEPAAEDAGGDVAVGADRGDVVAAAPAQFGRGGGVVAAAPDAADAISGHLGHADRLEVADGLPHVPEVDYPGPDRDAEAGGFFGVAAGGLVAGPPGDRVVRGGVLGEVGEGEGDARGLEQFPHLVGDVDEVAVNLYVESCFQCV
jgi:hypothetical protein